MNTKDYKIHIIGAGISGLVAASVLEQNGFKPVILESTERAGGRVKTDIVEKYQLDHGFQVLLTAYPSAQKYLDFNALELQHFLPGAVIFKNGKQKVIGDPLKELSLLFSTLMSGIGNTSDKLKVLKLNTYLKKKTIEEIFATEEKTSLSYLQDYGFSSEMISDFFTPFFSGIFLETKLETSSRMFEFVYKMFGKGTAAIPKAGMGAIPAQLLKKLKNTTLRYNTKVASVQDGQIVLEDGTVLESDYTIVATAAQSLISNLKNQETEWKSCETLYFLTENRTIDQKLIGLVPAKSSLINNIFFHNSLETSLKVDKQLLSVTVVDCQHHTKQGLIAKVSQELETYCGITVDRFLKQYSIPEALPKLQNLKYEMMPSETRLTSSLFLAGDTQLNSSLNAAMISGERAAQGVIETISSSILG